MRDLPEDLEAARAQAGIVSRQQVLRAGVSPEMIPAQLRSGRWQTVLPGTDATFSGPVPALSRLWADLLRAGWGAVAGPASTLWLEGILDRPPDPFDILIPFERRVRGDPAPRVRRRRGLVSITHPIASPPRLTVEAAVPEAAAGALRDADAVDLVVRAVQRRRTTGARLRRHLQERPRHPRRRLLLELLAEVGRGVWSPLELRWLRDVQRPHGLPAGELNQPEAVGARRRYRDVSYPAWLLVIELDGREAHPPEERFRDRRRDNQVTLTGRRTLRYGWREIADDPCGVAAEVAAVLRARGWPGAAHPCTRPSCTVS